MTILLKWYYISLKINYITMRYSYNMYTVKLAHDTFLHKDTIFYLSPRNFLY